MYGIYSELSNFDELEYTKKELEDLLERAMVKPSQILLFKIAATSEHLLKLLKQERYNTNFSPYLMQWKIFKGGRATVKRELHKLEDIEEITSRKDLTEGGVGFEIVKDFLPFGGYKKICGITLNNDDEKRMKDDGPITPEEMWAIKNGY